MSSGLDPKHFSKINYFLRSHCLLFCFYPEAQRMDELPGGSERQENALWNWQPCSLQLMKLVSSLQMVWELLAFDTCSPHQGKPFWLHSLLQPFSHLATTQATVPWPSPSFYYLLPSEAKTARVRRANYLSNPVPCLDNGHFQLWRGKCNFQCTNELGDASLVRKKAIPSHLEKPERVLQANEVLHQTLLSCGLYTRPFLPSFMELPGAVWSPVFRKQMWLCLWD